MQKAQMVTSSEKRRIQNIQGAHRIPIFIGFQTKSLVGG